MKIKIILLLLVAHISLFSQTTPDTAKVFLKGGMGIMNGDVFSAEGILVHASAGYIQKNRILSLRYVFSEEFVILGPKPVQYLNEYGVLYGREFANEYFRVSASAGLSLVTGNVRTTQELYTESGMLGSTYFVGVNYVTQGIPLELNASFIHFRWIELSANVLANLNSRNSFFGGSLCLGVGRLR